jgi:hypothetical protein
MPDFVPSRDPALLAFGADYSAQITAAPTSLGLTAAIATELASRQAAFAAALAASTNPATRGGSTVQAKNTAKASLVAYIRQTARTIQGTPTVTDQQKYDLGLTIRNAHPSPVPPPAHAPVLAVKSVTGRVVKFTLRDATSERRGKPAGVSGATVLSYVGATPPDALGSWKFEGSTGKTTVEVQFPLSVAPGSKVWLIALWFNPRKQDGPACNPVSTYLEMGDSVQLGLSLAA